MANRNFDAGYVVGKRLIDISGSFAPLTGSGTVVAANVRGLGFGYLPLNGTWTKQTSERPGITSTSGITRTGAGVYTVTLDDSYRDLYYLGGDFAAANTSGTGLWVQPVNNVSGTATAATGPTVTFLIVNSSGTPTDAASTSQRVYFHIQADDSTVGFLKP